MKMRVFVRLKHGVLDVQGKAVERGLHGLGFESIHDVRIGKLIEFDIASPDEAAARQEVDRMCRQLLANTVIESYEIVSGGTAQ